jgi:hypothetical protein
MVAVRRNMFQVEGKNMVYVRRKNVIKIVCIQEKNILAS